MSSAAPVDHQLAVERVAVDDVELHPDNPRIGDVDRIAESVAVNGQFRPLLVQRSSGLVIAGNHTLQAIRQLGWAEVDVTYLDVDDDEARRIMLADNRTSDLGSYDTDALAAVLEAVLEASDVAEAASAVAGTGYTAAEMSAIIDAANSDGPGGGDPDDADLPEDGYQPVSVVGDVWDVGPHRIVCGDSTEPAAYEALLAADGALVDMVWTDPPYGVNLAELQEAQNAMSSGKGGRRTDGKAVTNDDLTGAELRTFLDDAFGHAYEWCRPGGVWYVCAAGAQLRHFLNSLAALDEGLGRHALVWVKDRFVMGRADFHYRHEMLLYGWKPGAAHHTPSTRDLDSVWEHPRPARSPEHPTMKPVSLIEQSLVHSTAIGETVLDIFGGAGSTLVACHRRNRRARLIELDPAYADVCVARAAALDPQLPVLRNNEPADPPVING